ncbi:MAG: YdcH family protein [Sulfitobacter sp.]
MSAPSDLSMKNDDVLKVELQVFRREHRDLDDAIAALHDKASSDQLTLQRLKRRKLRLKDLIAQIEDRLTPDIIA